MSLFTLSPLFLSLFINYLLSSDLQLKSYHVPVKLFKKWNEFLTQYTTASYEICSTGTCTKTGIIHTHTHIHTQHVHVLVHPVTQYMYIKYYPTHTSTRITHEA